MRNTFYIVSGSVLALVFYAAIAKAREKRVNSSDLPPAVQKTAQRESQGATVRGYSKDVESGKIEDEVEMMVAGKSRDVSIDSSGKVIEVEQEVALDGIPSAAMAAIRRQAEGASIRKVEEVRSSAETAYEAQILSNGKHREIRVHADGSEAPEQD
jgi:uncharacterized membrane protein YkoI